MAVVGDGEDIDTVVANMLVATVKMGTSLTGMCIVYTTYLYCSAAPV